MRLVSLALAITSLSAPSLAQNPGEEPIEFEARSGDVVDAYRGSFEVPENRNNPDSRMIDIHYVRFPATGDVSGAPIVYLAGGPGGSGISTAREQRFPMFMAMREFGDVIALDQRGTGASNEIPACEDSGVILPYADMVTREALANAYSAAIAECTYIWDAQGVDIRGYTTVQSAADIGDLRAHLGVDQISLWGISYGTHLAFETIRQLGDPAIDKVVLTGAEGPGQTVKLPAETDAYFARVQAVIDDQLGEDAFDLPGLMRVVHARLDAEPARVTVNHPYSGEPTEIAFDSSVMRTLASAAIADPATLGQLIQIYQAAYAGMYDIVGQVYMQFLMPDEAIVIRGMPEAMDLASGISANRLSLVQAQAETSLLGDFLNFPMPHALGSIEGIDLGDEFRDNISTDVPTLLLMGTLDGRTYMDEQLEATAGFSDLSVVTVENAGHNLFMISPEVGDYIYAFMAGEFEADATITVPLPPIMPDN